MPEESKIATASDRAAVGLAIVNGSSISSNSNSSSSSSMFTILLLSS